jgi:ABC-type Fe3+ transport system substrate-binding protein
MKPPRLAKIIVFTVFLGACLAPNPATGAVSRADLARVKQEAEAARYIFFTSRDEIIAKAKAEGRVRLLSSFDGETYRPMINAFRQKYPFLDVQAEQLTGTEADQRFLLEIKTGTVRQWDAFSLTSESYKEYPAYLKRFDLLGMAKHGVLQIPAAMIDPDNRNIVALTSSVSIVAYNRSRIAPEKVPNTWEGFLAPELKGKKFLVDIRPHPYRTMVPAMGLEWVLDYCRKLAAQEPIWVRGQTRALASLAAGEYAMFAAVNYHSTMGVARKDPTGNLQVKVIEPIPVRLSATEAILNSAPHPHAALLWLEFQASPEGQKIIDDNEPVKSSVYSPGSAVEKLVRGKKLSTLDWKDYAESGELVEKIVAAFGFPKADKGR